MQLPQRTLSTTLHCLLSLSIAGLASAQTSILPRTNPNVIAAPYACHATFSCAGASGGWALGGGAIFDTTATLNGSNSVQLSTPGSYVASGRHWPVTPETTYTFSVYMKIDGNLPQARPQIIVGLYNSSDAFQRNVRIQSQAVNQSVSGWQEFVVVFQPKTGEVKAGFKIELAAQAADATTPTTFWVANAYLGQGISFEQGPGAKVPFDGSLVKVDALGNFDIYQNGSWSAFFPLCVYANAARADWSVYKTFGFNCNMWAWNASEVRKAKNAGLYSGYQLARFIDPTNADYNQLTTLKNDIDTFRAGGINEDLRDSVLFYYWDNENAQLDEWNVPAQLAATIDSSDRDASGNRQHPLYMLSDQVGATRKYNPLGAVSGTADTGGTILSLSDTVGPYVSQESHFNGDDYTQGSGLTILQNIEHQYEPVSIAIFNGNPTDGNYAGQRFRAAIYTAIARGARGIGYWKDCSVPCNIPNVPQIDSTPWATTLPAVAAAIQSQMPVIRAAEAHDWQLAKTSTTDNVQWGIRTVAGKGYVIAGNENAGVANATFGISGLGYTPHNVIDAVTRDSMAGIASGAFTLPLPANDGGFYLLGDNLPDTLALSLDFNGDLDDTSSVNNDNGATVGSGVSVSSTELVLSGGEVRIPAHPSLEMNGDISIVARVNISNSQTGLATIVSKGATTYDVAGYFFFYDNAAGKLRFWYGPGGTQPSDRNTLSATVPALTGSWHTIAVTAMLGGTVAFYVDGQAYTGVGTVQPELRNTMASPDLPLLIGAAGTGNHLQGSIDYLRIYKAALTATEIGSL